MAAHRKPKQSPLSGQAGRTAATLALAGAATATAFEGSGHAEPQLTAAQVKAKVDRLHHEAEIATEKYNGAKEKADQARDRLDALRDEAARRTERLNSARHSLGAAAAAQYRSGGLSPRCGWRCPPTPSAICAAPPSPRPPGRGRRPPSRRCAAGWSTWTGCGRRPPTGPGT